MSQGIAAPALTAGRRRAALALADWAAAEHGRFALWLPVFMAAGVVGYFALAFEPAWWVGGAAFAGLLGLGVLARPVRPPVWAAAAMALGFASVQLAGVAAPPVVDLPGKASVVVGTVRAVEPLPEGRRLTIERPGFDGAAPVGRSVRLRLRGTDETALQPGDTVRVRAVLMRPAPPAYPGGWDLQRDAYFAGQAGFGTALGPVERLDGATPSGPARWLRMLREGIAGRIRGVLSGPEAAIAATLLSGEAAAIAPADRAAFRDSGLAHLLAIAGLHIGIVMGFAFIVSRFAFALSERASLFWPTKKMAALFALAVGGAYMVETGMHVPIIRSFAMASLVTLGVIVGRRALSLRGLALAMAAVILIAPAEVVGVSFQMSFSAVLALIAGYDALRPWLSRIYGDGGWRRRLLGHVVALGLTSALAGTFSAPYGAYHFGHIQIYYVLANMLAVPLTAVWVMPAGMIALLLMPLHGEALALLPMGWGIEAVLWIGRSVSAWPRAVLAVPHMPDWGLVALSLGIAWLGLWRTRVRLAGVLAIGVGLVSPAFERAPDVLVSADARLIAVRTAEGVFVEKARDAARFTLDSWLQYWAVAGSKALPLAGEAAGGAIVCTLASCRIGEDAVLLRGGEGCGAPLVISAEPLRGNCPEGVRKIDRFTVWREGSQAVWLDAGGARVVADRPSRGDRPWVPPLPTRTRVPPGLTPALSEDLPPE